MAYVKSWSTKEEVLKDLAKASGRRIKKEEDLHEGYFVVGDAPPPVIPENEDDEMHMLFGEAASRKPAQTEEDATPDLLGIQQMLRMMQEFDGDDDGTNEAKDCVIAISKVSKLNPNVEEFKPKGAVSSSPTLNKDKNNSPNKISINIKDKNVVAQTVDVINKDSSSKNGTNKDKNNSPNKISINIKDKNVVAQTVDVINKDSSSKNGTEVNTKIIDLDVDVDEDIATTLKNQISDAGKSDSYEHKKQKNVAIATLLRLYAKNNTSPKKSAEPLKLFTPEYFEGKKEDSKVECITKAQSVTSPATASTPEPKDSSSTLPSSSTSTCSTPKASPKIKIDPEIKKSIDKVNNWLEEPTKRKSPAVCLGPIAFKRKDPVNCKSPSSDSAPKARKPKSAQEYVPSKYAADLGKRYLERSKVKESENNVVNWSNLEDKLKEKDMLIKKRLEDQGSASDS